MEQIFIQDLEVFGRHGVYAQEKEKGQTFLVQARADLDFSAAAREDALERTVNYGELCYLIRDFFERERYDLLETAAEKLAMAILETYPGVSGLYLEIGKPQAPIEMKFKNVGVRVEKRFHRAALSIGSNMGDKKAHLDFAVETLSNDPAIRNLTVSDYISTSPYGYAEQDDFLNAALTFDTCLTPEQLLDCLHEIEVARNRERIIRWGPRTLDLDIVLYDDWIINRPELTIPHTDMHNRLFVLKPLAQIAPGWVHPWKHKNIKELYEELADDKEHSV